MKILYSTILIQLSIVILYGQRIEIYPAYLEPQPGTNEASQLFENQRRYITEGPLKRVSQLLGEKKIYMTKEPLFSSEAGDIEDYMISEKSYIIIKNEKFESSRTIVFNLSQRGIAKLQRKNIIAEYYIFLINDFILPNERLYMKLWVPQFIDPPHRKLFNRNPQYGDLSISVNDEILETIGIRPESIPTKPKG